MRQGHIELFSPDNGSIYFAQPLSRNCLRLVPLTSPFSSPTEAGLSAGACLSIFKTIASSNPSSTGDFEEVLAALLGKDAGGLSASTVARLKDAWVDEHVRWSKRDLTAKRYVYFWVDGIHC